MRPGVAIVSIAISVTTLGAAMSLSLAEAEEPRELAPVPFELAFSHVQFPEELEIAVSPDYRQVAFTTWRPSAASPQNERYLPNGTPSGAVGKRLFVISLSGHQNNEVCAGNGNHWRPSWSRDGRLLAFYSDADGAPRLWAFDRDTGLCRRVSAAVAKTSYWSMDDEAQWSRDDRTAFVPVDPTPSEDHSYFVSKPKVIHGQDVAVTVYRSGSEQGEADRRRTDDIQEARDYFTKESNSVLQAIDVRSGQGRVLVAADTAPRPWDDLKLSPSGRWLAYRSVRYYPPNAAQLELLSDLAVVPTDGGPVLRVAGSLPLSTHPLNRFGLDFRWHPQKDWIVYLKEDRLWLVDLTSGSPTEPRQLASSLGPLAPAISWFTRDGSSILVGVSPVGVGRDRMPTKLALVSLSDSSNRFLPFDSENWALVDVLRTDARTLWQPDGRSVTLQVRDKRSGDLLVVRLDPATQIRKVLWRGSGKFAGLSSGGSQSFIVGTYESFRSPPDLYRFSADFARWERLTAIEPRLVALDPGSVHVIETEVPTSDGAVRTTRTAILLPPGAKQGCRLPALVVIYPGSDLSRVDTKFSGGMGNTIPNDIYTTRGYAVLMTEISDAALGPERAAGSPVRRILDVLLPQLYHATDLGYVDLRRLALSGQSYGGYSTAAVVSQTNLFRAAIPISGVFDLGHAYGRMFDDGSSFNIRYMETGQARMGDQPWANVLRYIENSPYYQLDKISTPMLLIAGDADTTVPVEESKSLFVGLRRLNRNAQLAVYAGEGHEVSEWGLANAVDASRRTIEFLGRYLGPGSVCAR